MRTGRAIARFTVAVLLVVPVLSACASGRFEGGIFYGVDLVEIDGELLAFEIVGTSGGATEVIVGDLASNVEFRIEQSGRRLVIEVDREFTLFRTGRNDPIIVKMPASAALEAATASGSIRVRNLDSDGIAVRSASGAIDAERLSGDVRISTTSGSITLAGASGELEINSVSGGVVLRDLDGELSVGTTSGSVDMDSVRGAIEVRTVSGSIDAVGIDVRDDCSFASISGGIEVDFINPESDFRFDLSSTSGSLRAFDSRGQRILRSGDGRFVVTGSSVSGSQEYR